MCFSSPPPPPKPAPVTVAPPKKTPEEIKANSQKEAEVAATKSNKTLSKQKNRKSFRIKLGGYSGGGGGGSGLSL